MGTTRGVLKGLSIPKNSNFNLDLYAKFFNNVPTGYTVKIVYFKKCNFF